MKVEKNRQKEMRNEESYLLKLALIINRELLEEEKISYEMYKRAEDGLWKELKKEK